MVPIRTISSPSEGGRKPQGENHQALAVKGERHPTCSLKSESNPGCSGERRTCYHSATKWMTCANLQQCSHWPRPTDNRISQSRYRSLESVSVNVNEPLIRIPNIVSSATSCVLCAGNPAMNRPNSPAKPSTLGSAYNEFSYYEQFFSWEGAILIGIDVKKFGYNKYCL